jgi:hypothetical protein
MIFLRLLNAQGIAGLAAAVALTLLLLLQKGETRHWKKSSGEFEQLYRAELSAFASTVAEYRSAAERARSADAANAARVRAEQQAINQRTANDFQARIDSARAAAVRLRIGAKTTSDSGPAGKPPVPGLSAAPERAAQGAGEGRLPAADALIATEQAIQLDELIKWVRAMAKVDNSGQAAAQSPGN